MPYRYAHWWVMVVLAVIFIGFWPSYWSIPREVHWIHHLHGIVSTIWVVMVITQSWSVHNKRLPLHRASGQASLYLFPFLIAGLLGVQAVNAQAYAAGEGLLSPTYGPAFLFGLIVAAAAYVTLYYRALKYRRKVWSHSAYLLGTPMILFESPAGRMFNLHFPPLQFDPANLGIVMKAILFSDALMVAICVVLWWRARSRSNAFAVVGGFIALQIVVMAGLYYGGGGGDAVRAVATIPTPVMIGLGFLLGAATSYLGWQAGKTAPKVPAGAVAA